MEIFDFAMKMEQDGEAYYRKLADEANNPGLASILNFLADEEVKHYKIFKKLRDGQTDELPESTLLSDVTNIFEDLSKEYETNKETPFEFSADQPQFYRKAQDLEKQSEMFYRDKAEDTEDEKTKTLMLKIADEEKRHYFVLENIIDFVTHPKRWIEDAEWSKIGSSE
jgi:rubrerythrin